MATLCYEALRAAGHRVGIYTSPHLVDVRERMVVDGRPISEEAFAAWAERLRRAIEKSGASFFEATTAIAFADLAARGVDIAVIEVGLGGRLDCTNVLDPLVSAVTHVGLEHTEYLGSTLTAIAREKAGIAKAGKPFVLGETDPAVAQAAIEVALAAGARVVRVPPLERYDDPLALVGAFQRRNAAVARAVLRELPSHWRPAPEEMKAGFASARLAGRFDRRGKWVFDVAHNPGGVAALAGVLREQGLPRPIHAVVGILRDKDWPQMLETLGVVADRMWLTQPPTAPEDRRWDLATVGKTAPGHCTIQPAFERALRDAQVDARTVLVTGSFHTVGDALARLPGFAPLG